MVKPIDSRISKLEAENESLRKRVDELEHRASLAGGPRPVATVFMEAYEAEMTESVKQVIRVVNARYALAAGARDLVLRTVTDEAGRVLLADGEWLTARGFQRDEGLNEWFIALREPKAFLAVDTLDCPDDVSVYRVNESGHIADRVLLGIRYPTREHLDDLLSALGVAGGRATQGGS
jgi:hypothetical protein